VLASKVLNFRRLAMAASLRKIATVVSQSLEDNLGPCLPFSCTQVRLRAAKRGIIGNAVLVNV
jgi:hypothetical protein